jgi:hypothetical protein
LYLPSKNGAKDLLMNNDIRKNEFLEEEYMLNHYHIPGTDVKGLAQSAMKGLKGHQAGNAGNVCAYVSDVPVLYNELQIRHWPSQDYEIPHPKGFAHTMHTTQTVTAHHPSRSVQPEEFTYFPHSPHAAHF